jgi:hypothetical protein
MANEIFFVIPSNEEWRMTTFSPHLPERWGQMFFLSFVPYYLFRAPYFFRSPTYVVGEANYFFRKTAYDVGAPIYISTAERKQMMEEANQSFLDSPPLAERPISP